MTVIIMLNIVNLTPHKISIQSKQGWVEIHPNGIVPRVKEVETPLYFDTEIHGIEFSAKAFAEVEGLPEPKEDTIYIVSSLILSAAKGRQDLFAPSALLRDKEGNIIGCKGLYRL